MTRLLYEFLILLVVLTYAIIIFADPNDHPFLTKKFVQEVDYCMIAFFGVEYLVRLWRSENPKKFMVSNWFDLIAMIPFDMHFQLARVMRLIRLIRILKASPLLWSVVSSKQMRMIMIFMLVIVAWSSVGILLLESGHNRGIQDYGDAIWWAIVTMTTVGYGDVSPTTEGGRIIAVFLMFTGIGLIGTFTANLANHWVGFSYPSQGTGEPERDENRVRDQMKNAALQWLYRIETLTDQEYRQLLSVMEALREGDRPDGKDKDKHKPA
ncbi:ion transporter [Tumebacillus amylolyticus]|nr:ion transporter [Tumebacillus amylolyticus]